MGGWFLQCVYRIKLKDFCQYISDTLSWGLRFMAAFDNSSIAVKVLEPRTDGEEGKFYWGLVAKPAPRELFPMKVKSSTTVGELKQRIMKERGFRTCCL